MLKNDEILTPRSLLMIYSLNNEKHFAHHVYISMEPINFFNYWKNFLRLLQAICKSYAKCISSKRKGKFLYKIDIKNSKVVGQLNAIYTRDKYYIV